MKNITTDLTDVKKKGLYWNTMNNCMAKETR